MYAADGEYIGHGPPRGRSGGVEGLVKDASGYSLVFSVSGGIDYDCPAFPTCQRREA